MISEPLILCAIVVNWRCERQVQELLAGWPEDSRIEVIVVDNESTGSRFDSRARVLRVAENLGFAGGVNRALPETRAPWVLILNPDARPLPGALDQLLRGIDSIEGAAGLAPRLVSTEGSGQHRWQLRSLPSLAVLLLQALLVPAGGGSKREPAAGTVIEQPAAAALALRRHVLMDLGGFDADFFPAWFEDVDLARRFKAAGRSIVYWPQAVFVHELGATVGLLGFGPFLWYYYRNLCRYLRKHHGRFFTALARLFLSMAAPARCLILPLRRPTRASSRTDALLGLAGLALGAASGWRLPPRCRRQLSRRDV